MKFINSALAATIALSSFIVPGLAPQAQAEKVYTGEVCTVAVHKLTSDIHWETKLNAAEAEAAKDNKLVFWMHMVGKIDGAT
jgi:ABC-type sugar transport system substrate-binding protein